LLTLATGACVLATAAFGFGSQFLADPISDWIINIGLLVAALFAATACIYAARSQHRGDGLAWTLLSVALFLWAIAALGNTAYTVTGQTTQAWSLLIGGVTAAGVVVALFSIFCFTSSYISRSLQIVSLIDSVIVALAILGVAWVSVLRPSQLTHGSVTATTVMFMAILVCDLAVTALALILFMRSRHLGGSIFIWILGGSVALLITDAAVAYMSATGGIDSFSGVWSARFAAYLLFGLGALRARPAPKLQPSRATLPTYFEVLFPYPMVVVATLFSVANAIISGDVSSAFGLRIAVLALLIVRHVITVIQNLSMLHVLSAEADVLHGYFAQDPGVLVASSEAAVTRRLGPEFLAQGTVTGIRVQ